MPVLKIGLDDKTHRAFKVWCAESGLTMQDAVFSLIDRQMGSTVEPPVSKVEEVVREQKAQLEPPKP